jgi:hypothetical protein
MHRGFWWENQKGKDYLKDLGVDGKNKMVVSDTE